MNLTALADRFGSDKGTLTGDPPHRYSYLYDLVFTPYRDKEFRFLEMGLAVGGPELGGAIDRTVTSPSIKMWLEYFSSAHIHGFDISDFSHMEHPRFTFIRGDSGSVADLERLAASAPSFDIIIDDASHASYHQQLALKILFPSLTSGGLYIIEDLQWQPRLMEKELPPIPTTARFLNAYFERAEYLENSLFSEAEMVDLKRNTAHFASFPNFGRKILLRQFVRKETRTKLIIFRKR